jgi:hypothetical protein
MASPWPDKVVPLHLGGLKNKKPLVRSFPRGTEGGRVRKKPDQRLCWWRPSLDADIVTRRPTERKAIGVPVRQAFDLQPSPKQQVDGAHVSSARAALNFVQCA